MKIITLKTRILIILTLLTWSQISSTQLKVQMNSSFHFKSANLGKSKSEPANDILFKTNNPINKDMDVPDLPVYHQTWIKYFHYKKINNQYIPKSFFKNKDFNTQLPQSGSNSTQADTVYFIFV